ncbi:MAG: hypothetical protein QM831_29355 [Kofleriaceae bacterium]
MRRSLLLMCGLAGCDQLWGLDKDLKPRPDASGSPQDTAGVDAPVPCTGTMVGHGMYMFCVTDVSMKSLSGTIDTSGGMCAMDSVHPELCIVQGGDVTIGVPQPVKGQGPRPLVIAATGNLTVMGTIDVSSDKTTLGAGIDIGGITGCDLGDAAASAGDGGPGGSFAIKGGFGGKSQGGNAMPGKIVPAPTILTLRPGCPGGPGAGAVQSSVGAGGNPGGALYLATASELRLPATAVIRANGAGGNGASVSNGGGGGGTGGLIVLDAASYNVMAGSTISANGGGGGEGGSTIAGTDGQASNAYNVGGKGGMGVGSGGDGGDGAALMAASGSGAGALGAGAGGGGGAIGYVIVYGASDWAGRISPTPTFR